MRSINKIIIHCSNSPEGRNDKAEDIRKWHKQRGFSDIGYHFIIDLDGTIELGRPICQAGAHCTGHNRDSIGICYIGGAYWRDGVNAKGKPIKGKDDKTVLIPKDTRTLAQRLALQELVRQLVSHYPFATVHGHREFANKACPCFDVQAWFKESIKPMLIQ